MLRFDVYHATPPDFSAERALSSFPEGYALVARVFARDVDHAFELTNHIDRLWWENEGVGVVGVRNHRSTSVGDVVVRMGDPQARVAYRCEDVGWTEFTPTNAATGTINLLSVRL